MSRQEHIERHVALHHSLDELVADFIRHTGKRPSQSTVLELMQWAADQTQNPTEPDNGEMK